MAEAAKMKEIVQYKSTDVSVYRHKDDGTKAGGSGSAGDSNDVWCDDVCGLEVDLANDLIGVIVEQEKPLTICLDGQWGTGKTFFLTRLVETFRRQGGTALYYNAWADDFLDDPLISIVAQFGDENIPNRIFDAVKKAAKPILAEMGWNLTKRFAGQIVGQIVKNKIGVDVSALSIGDADAIAGHDALDTYKEMDKARSELKTVISELAEKNWQEHHNPLLFVIDEIDRCRPTFAVEVLERVKHLFSVDHMVFVFGADKIQLMESIRSVYGNINAQDYLNRLFDLDLHLPKVPCDAFVDRLWSCLQYERIMPSVSWKDFLDIFRELVQTSGLSLRQIEHCVRLLPFIKNQIARQRGQLDSFCLPLLAGGVILKVVDGRMYQDLLQAKLPICRMMNALFKDSGRGWGLPHSEEIARILYGAFYEFEDQKHSILTLARNLSTRGRIGVNDLEIENAEGELPVFMSSWSDDEIKKFYKDVSGFLVHKDKVNLGVKSPDLTLQVLQYALMLA